MRQDVCVGCLAILILSCVSVAAYDLSQVFVHSKIELSEHGLDPGTSVRWQVSDPTGATAFEDTVRADSSGIATSGAWIPGSVGEHEINVTVGDAEPFTRTISVLSLYVLDTPYIDDFGNPDAGRWYRTYWKDGGHVEIINSRQNKVSQIACPIVADRCVVQVTVSFPGCDNPAVCGAGVLFGLSDDSSFYYLVAITPVGTFGIQKFTGGAFKTIAGPVESKHLRKGMDTENVIRLEIQASRVLIFFNGQSVGRLNASVPEGRVGLVVANYAGSTTAHFDDFSLVAE